MHATNIWRDPLQLRPEGAFLEGINDRLDQKEKMAKGQIFLKKATKMDKDLTE